MVAAIRLRHQFELDSSSLGTGNKDCAFSCFEDEEETLSYPLNNSKFSADECSESNKEIARPFVSAFVHEDMMKIARLGEHVRIEDTVDTLPDSLEDCPIPINGSPIDRGFVKDGVLAALHSSDFDPSSTLALKHSHPVWLKPGTYAGGLRSKKRRLILFIGDTANAFMPLASAQMPAPDSGRIISSR
ncbi:hypothetical protein LX36DRAFT_752718 [Colletotrichum falcatum]|nr:hypothetical protein LX36DRAFT_752718 [Colletotrichum falcatum]